MKGTKELLFSGISSLIVILGLCYLKVLGLEIAYAPLLMAATFIGIFALKQSVEVSKLGVFLVAIAGVIAGIALQPNPQTSYLVSPVMGFGIALALPAIMLELRKTFIKTK
jgi:hypothetical protein